MRCSSIPANPQHSCAVPHPLLNKVLPHSHPPILFYEQTDEDEEEDEEEEDEDDDDEGEDRYYGMIREEEN